MGCAYPRRCRPLPQPAADPLEQLQSALRLAAHLRVVHDVACQIAGWTDRRDPALSYNRDAMRLGAATHDTARPSTSLNCPSLAQWQCYGYDSQYAITASTGEAFVGSGTAMPTATRARGPALSSARLRGLSPVRKSNPHCPGL
jgi:hypothetical protein